MKATKKQKAYMKIWRKRHPNKNRINTYRNSAKLFIRHYASYSELKDLQKMIDFYEPKRKKKATVN